MNSREQPQSAGTVVQCLARWARTEPNRVALRFLGDGEQVSDTLTFAELDARARKIAGHLQQISRVGERALLLFPSGTGYIDAFFGCLYAGVVAVPAYPPEAAQPQQLKRLWSIVDDCKPRLILTLAVFIEPLRAVLAASGRVLDIELVAVDAVDSGGAQRYRAHAPDANAVAFLQYTSGSTSEPKGVIIGHDNLAANELSIQRGFGIEPNDTIVTWLPLYHDMGLIGGLLQPLFSGANLVLMSPRHFLEKPARWLEAIARFQGSVSGAPDFAYRMCTERVSDAVLDRLDLSSWRVAFSGSEPVREATLQLFAERFSRRGFDAKAFYPCYGLAESALFVSGGQRGDGARVVEVDKDALARGVAEPGATPVRLVGCGWSDPNHRIIVADLRTGAALGDNVVGEIWVAGPSLAHGYFGNPEATAETFVEHSGMRYLRTGDLGFTRQKQLFVSGRKKDLIIVRGQNVYPQDVESTLEASVEALRKGRIAAFAVENQGQESIGVAAEIVRGMQKFIHPEAVAQAVREVVAERHGEAPALVALLAPGALPKTSSGKLQRLATARAIALAELETVFVWRAEGFKSELPEAPPTGEEVGAPVSARREVIRNIWQRVLGVERVEERDNFFALGGNSVAVVSVIAEVERDVGVRVEPSALWCSATLEAFAAAIEGATAERSQEGEALAASPAQDRAERSTHSPPTLSPLSPSQRRFWLLWKLRPDSAAYHVQAAVGLQGSLGHGSLGQPATSEARWERALENIVQRHTALRTVFDERGTHQIVRARSAVCFVSYDFATASSSLEQSTALARAAAEADAREPFDLVTGPLVRVSVGRLGPERHVLWVTAHHVAVDGFSLQLLLEELVEAYFSANGPAGRLEGQPGSDYTKYAAGQLKLLEAPAAFATAIERYRSQRGDGAYVLRLPIDRPRPVSPSQVGASVHFELPAELTRSMHQLARAHELTPFAVLLGAFKVLLYRLSGEMDIRVGVPMSNRTSLDAMRVIGPLVNTAVSRSVLSGAKSFSHLLGELRGSLVMLQRDQALPFELLVQALGVRTDPSHTPLFQVLYNHQVLRWSELEQRCGLELELLPWEPPTAPFDLVLDTYEDDQGRCFGRFGYARELFEETTI
ncbi:MAG TPA: AMP-binding protein, partial [Polyangiaceae bacterium]|nr:AMP-binding protein [Polyangiaceae bacterium]